MLDATSVRDIKALEVIYSNHSSGAGPFQLLSKPRHPPTQPESISVISVLLFLFFFFSSSSVFSFFPPDWRWHNITPAETRRGCTPSVQTLALRRSRTGGGVGGEFQSQIKQ
jgi:hypothetical protein